MQSHLTVNLGMWSESYLITENSILLPKCSY